MKKTLKWDSGAWSSTAWIVKYTLWILTLQGLTLAPWIIILWIVHTRVNTLGYQHMEFPQYCVMVKNHQTLRTLCICCVVSVQRQNTFDRVSFIVLLSFLFTPSIQVPKTIPLFIVLPLPIRMSVTLRIFNIQM